MIQALNLTQPKPTTQAKSHGSLQTLFIIEERRYFKSFGLDSDINLSTRAKFKGATGKITTYFFGKMQKSAILCLE